MSEQQPILKMEQIDKSFPGVHALDDVDFDLYPGEVHVLIGENGAGKSTLMKILQGSLQRDSGNIVVDGQKVAHLTPRRSQELGIAMVFQELSLMPNLSVAENILTGHLPRSRGGLINWKEARKRAQEALSELGMNIDVRKSVQSLNIAEQQLTEIAANLTRNPSILLLDEPTSALSDAEIQRLFDIIRHLKERGVGIIYVSHHLSEVMEIGDRVTVLRDGKRIGTHLVSEVDVDTLINMMVGRQLDDLFPKHQIEQGEVVLRVENLRLGDRLHDLSFDVHAGEILAVFGLMGAGQQELAHAIFGLAPEAHAKITIEGRQVQIKDPNDAIKHGMGLLMSDRRGSLVPRLPIPANTTLAKLSQSSMLSLMNLREERQATAEFVKDLRITPPILNRLVMFLSGGNQQKVVLARWLFSGAKVLIFDQPTRGIDVGAKAEVYTLMNELTQRGVSILMISSELPEILAMSDRVLVMRGGRFAAEYRRGEASQEDLVRSAN